jgi:hypothetical protein
VTRPFDIDRVLEDWLADGPSRFPDHAIRETIAGLDTVPQRGRVSLPDPGRVLRSALSFGAVAAVLVVALVSFATLTGWADGFGAGGPAGPTHTSERHRYTVVLPDDTWKVEEQGGSWELAEHFDAGSGAGMDSFEDLDASGEPVLYVWIASQPIPSWMPFEDWVGAHDRANNTAQPCFQPIGPYEQWPVDGEMSRTGTYRCDDFEGPAIPWMTVQTLVAHGGRGYAIYVWPADQGSEAPSVSDLERESARWLARFSFTD